MGLPCRVRVNYRGYAVAVHRRLCYPHVTSAAVVYGGRLRRKILLYLPTVLIFPFLPTLQSHIFMRLSSVPRSPFHASLDYPVP